MSQSKFSHECLAKILENHNPALHLVDFRFERGTNSGDNYMSEIHNLRLNVKEKDGQIEEMCLILKALPTNPPILKYMRELRAFEKEITMFESVFPTLCQGSSYGSLLKVIHTQRDGQDDFLIMEDLKEAGYKMADRIKGLDFDHAKVVISEMAKFHALSFLKFGGDGEKILEAYPDLVDMFWVSPDQVSERNKAFINGQLSGVKQVMIEENLGHVNSRIDRQFEDVFGRMHKLVSIPEKFPSVINFGDCWANNMMFKYDDEGTVTSVKFLDFQLARVTSRCSDFAYFIYTSLCISVLNERFNELLRIYHEAFALYVNANSQSDSTDGTSLTFKGQELSWEYFNLEFEHYRSHGTTLALIYTPLMLASFEAVPDLDRIDGKDLENMGNDKNSSFASVWKCKAVREKLIAVASGHLPMCFKPAQPPVS